ncbi:hypothetical protein FBUS_09351 [Fasciolopsis buskii]|uniref:Uncharacterized protein n=1 Tax=Fasciolopsis buskii TaxID=27845 RepID=A0A8E0RQF1_9TREM|nr:hypothetical protein FBUS_09351 [Fasciolopsis buski]
MTDMTDPSDLSACSLISVPDGKLTEAMILLRSRGEQLDMISKVNLWGLGISDASILRKMTNLRIVSMSTNLLCSLDSFSACIQLQELYLRSNRIGDIHQVAHLKFLTKLQKLWLENNPCCETEPKEQCRYSIVRNLTSLTHLDLKDTSLDFDVNSATLIETNKIRHECGLEPLVKNKISPPVRSLQPPAREQERLIRNAVLRLLRTLNSRSLETIIHAAERQIYRLERNRIESSEFQQSVQEEADWEENSNYDCSNYLDSTL